MRYTLLDLVQRILESMDSDEVDTFSSTPESTAVANIVKENYFNIISEIGPKNTETLFHLDASTDNLLPTVMYLPAQAVNIQKLEYNVSPQINNVNLRELRYAPLIDFLDYVNGLDEDQSWVNIQTVDFDGQDFTIKYRNDVSPTYWTSPDDHTILMDSYDSTYETTLTASRTYAYGNTVPVFLMEDDFVPDLDPRHFQLLLNAAKAQAFGELKQTSNTQAEKKERRNRILAYKTKDSTNTLTALQKHNRLRGYGRC